MADTTEQAREFERMLTDILAEKGALAAKLAQAHKLLRETSANRWECATEDGACPDCGAENDEPHDAGCLLGQIDDALLRAALAQEPAPAATAVMDFRTAKQAGVIAGDGKPCQNDHDPDCRWPQCHCRAAPPASAPAEPVAPEPDGTLHDDGCFTWKSGRTPRERVDHRVGWRADFWLQPTVDAAIAAARREERERCAKVCESLVDLDDDSCDEAERCAAALRSLGDE